MVEYLDSIGASEAPTNNTLPNEPIDTVSVEELMAIREAANGLATDFEALGVAQHGLSDPRIPRLHIGDISGQSSHSFLVDKRLIDEVKSATERRGSELRESELLPIAHALGHGAVHEAFLPDGLNAINASYYASPVAFSPEGLLASVFAESEPLNVMLGSLMASQSTPGKTLRVKELCSGDKLEHWQHIATGAIGQGVANVDAVVSDFVARDVNPGLQSSRLTLRSETYSLFDDMPTLPEEDRFDAMLTTYGFDSVWLPQDIRLAKINGAWHQELYRVKVAEWNKRGAELIEAMRAGKPLPNATWRDYDGIVVERTLQPIDLSEHPWREQIEATGVDRLNVPGGLICRAMEAFDTQLKRTGIFVSSDVVKTDTKEASWPYVVSGIAGFYHVDDIELAAQILSQYGFRVDTYPYSRLYEEHLPNAKEYMANKTVRDFIKSSDNNMFTLTVRRADSAVAETR